jgi:hypothetical protein
MLLWTNRVIGYQDPEHADAARDPAGRPVNPRSPAALADMFAYADELAAHKRRNPADDVMTALVHAEVDGQGLTAAELEMFFFLLVIAGTDTTRSALPGGVLALAEHPDAYRRLRADPGLLGPALEEMLRWHPPVLSFRRTATRDLGLAGTPIAHAEYLAADLVRVAHPLHLDYQIQGLQLDGFLDPGKTATLRFFAAAVPAGTHACAKVPVTATIPVDGDKSPVPYTLAGVKRKVTPGVTSDVRVPLEFKGRPNTAVKLTSPAKIKLADNRVESVQVGYVSVAPC